MSSNRTDHRISEQKRSADSGVDAVMIRFQQTMLLMTSNFLKTQEQVMLMYLQTRTSSPPHNMGGAPPAAALPINLSTINLGKNLEFPPEEQLKEPISELSQAEGAGFDLPQIQESISFESTSATSVACSNASIPPKSAEELIARFIELVSERTGYPAEMLDPALDLESDLGIDSIKRVEILSNFRRLLPEPLQEKFEGDLEELGGLRTLQAISDWIRKIPLAGP